jgi:hypothetical protein
MTKSQGVVRLELELRRQNGFTRHISWSQCLTKHAYHEKIVKPGAPTNLYMQILFDTIISSLKHIVNDMKVLQNIRHTCNIALPIAPHGNLGPTLLRHQITEYLLQTTKNTVKFSSNDFHESGRWFCLYPRHPHPRCHVEGYRRLHTYSQGLKKSHWL